MCLCVPQVEIPAKINFWATSFAMGDCTVTSLCNIVQVCTTMYKFVQNCTSLYNIEQACMKLHKLECSYISLHEVT